MFKNKKILYAVAIIILIAILLLIWNFFVPKPISPPEIPSSTITPEGELPAEQVPKGGNGETTTTSIQTPTLTKLSDRDVFAYWLQQATGEVYYLGINGIVWAAKDNEDELESKQTLQAIQSIETIPNGQKILVAFDNPNNPSWAIFNTRDKTWHPLPQFIKNATWGSNENQLLAVTTAPGPQSLSFIDLSPASPTVKPIIKNFYLTDISLKFNSPTIAIVSEKPSITYSGRLWEINIKNGAFNEILPPQLGLYTVPTTDGTFIYTMNGDRETFILNTQSISTIKLPFPTFPNKCDLSFSTSSQDIFCFSPINISNNIILPDDYLKQGFYSIDILYRYNQKNGDTASLLLSGAPGIPIIDATEVMSFKNNIYFINRYDHSLYRLTLPEN